MSDTKYVFLMIYNAVVIVATALSVYYVSGWMFFLIAAVMKPQVIPDDKDTMEVVPILSTAKPNNERLN